ncbi:MAG: amino acid transporter [Euryarchaeota archaeon]|uniref:Arginine exporter protein (LysE, argO) n=2 Tax=environmental samples TaxID=68359 RepID=A0A075FU12_9EURY|nr:transporter, LysE family protein (lysE, argO) [uncultured marine group II/III euryarchaeote AD1000_44_A01]AIE95155.1 arginine exporter protein (lysE, argO) [uncultured marine group II/III euryarchaeote AD1000_58_G05]MAJ18932.1 amino acid transporter [Euryarchaeota archaeon]MCH1511866.1 LysE/ArgO family amino acid transporter [Candidatus Thalassarchaeaceae archaeon]MDC0040200.1 LysE/ArgO family amino acid transporter [Candidatus Poseidoniales archaeon]|tara:strand:+ start:6686 stop:7297 length:612 start_codon:yes stop_codon:yes gene_type:complete
MLDSALEGFALSIGLILALGPQNVFVMRQGLMRSHVFAVCLACSVFDALLITAGVLGVGSILAGIEGAEFMIAIGASIFLISYGLLRIKSAISPVGMSTEGEGESDLAPTIAAAAAFTFLNPHVYVDTLLLIGGTSSRYLGDDRLAFGIGAATASFVFFFSLGYGARSLSEVLNKPKAWRYIDLSIASIMFIIAAAIMQPHLW